MTEALLTLTGLFQNTAASLVAALPVGYAFGAGMVASVNPCGFLMLPAFGSYYLGLEEEAAVTASAPQRLLRALLLGWLASLGFVALFGAMGLVLVIGGRQVVKVFPWAGLAVGLGLLGLGLWLLVTRRSLGIMAASRLQAPFGRGVHKVFLFGVAYGVCSLSCTLPIFLVVVGTALVSGSLLSSLGQFLSYGLGMGTTLVLVTISVALFKGALTAHLRRLLPLVHQISAAIMVLAGAGITAYWVLLGPWRI